MSCFFLLATLIVYSSLPKLLNAYTRLLRHYVANIMIAFLILSIFKIHKQKVGPLLKDSHSAGLHPGLCETIGKMVFSLHIVGINRKYSVHTLQT